MPRNAVAALTAAGAGGSKGRCCLRVLLLQQKPPREQLTPAKTLVSRRLFRGVGAGRRSRARTRSLPLRGDLEGPGGLPGAGPVSPACRGLDSGTGLSNGSARVWGGKPLGCGGKSYSIFPVKGGLDGGAVVLGEAVPRIYQGRLKETAYFAVSSWLALNSI